MMAFIEGNWILLVIAIILAAIWLIGMVNKKMNSSFEQARKEAEAEAEKKPKAEIKSGTKVTLDSGIYGVVKSVKDKTFMIEIAPGVVIEVEKYGVIFVRDN